MSLVLFIAVGALWVRGHWTVDSVVWVRPKWSIFLAGGAGQFRFELDTPISDVRYLGFRYFNNTADGPLWTFAGSHVWFEAGGFWIVTGQRWDENRYALFVPAWFMVASTLWMPLPWCVQQFRGRRLLLPGVCRLCGYDVRATPERCPECGEIWGGNVVASH